MSNAVTERILRSRGDLPSNLKADGSNEPDYVAYRDTGAHQEMSFQVHYVREGYPQQEQIFFHEMSSPRFRSGKGGEYINFFTRHLSVQIRGQNIQPLMAVMGSCTLIEINELDHRLDYIAHENETIITRIDAKDLRPSMSPMGNGDDS